MVKIIDLDKVFDKFIKSFVYENIGKVKPEEIENKIPQLYLEFASKNLTELGGETPTSYYEKFTAEELLNALYTHVETGVSVSDFLIESLLKKEDCEEKVANAIKEDSLEEFTTYLMNILNDKKSKLALSRYLEFVLYDYSEPIRELAIELLTEFADLVKEQVLVAYSEQTEEKRVYLTEILSGASKDDRVFNILINEKFKAINAYIRPNGHFIPMKLTDISDESEYNIDNRTYYSQSFLITVMAYVIPKDSFIVEELPEMKLIGFENENRNTSYAEIEENPCVQNKKEYDYLPINLKINFGVCSNMYKFTIDTYFHAKNITIIRKISKASNMVG